MEPDRKRRRQAMDYTALREKIRQMQDEIIGGIQDCIRIDSVGGNRKKEPLTAKAQRKRWSLR